MMGVNGRSGWMGLKAAHFDHLTHPNPRSQSGRKGRKTNDFESVRTYQRLSVCPKKKKILSSLLLLLLPFLLCEKSKVKVGWRHAGF